MYKSLVLLITVGAWCLLGLEVNYWLFVPVGGSTVLSIPTAGVAVFWPVVLVWHFLVYAFWAAIVAAVIFLLFAFGKGFVKGLREMRQSRARADD